MKLRNLIWRIDNRWFASGLLLVVVSITVQSQVELQKSQDPQSNQSQSAVLDDASRIRMSLEFFDPVKNDSTTTASQFLRGDKITIRLLFTHYYLDPQVISETGEQFRDTQIELLQDNVALPYLKSVQQSLARTEAELPTNSIAITTLLPDKEYKLAAINLSDWFGVLPPGHYQVTVKRRFSWAGKWIASEPLTFDIRAAHESPGIPRS